MYSDERNRCSHRLGFPIRKSPDHRLLASSRGLSQLTTSFIASLRQGIHTHALSSLTIKSISNTKCPRLRLCAYSIHSCAASPPAARTRHLREAANTCSKYCPSNIQLSKIRLLRTYCSEDAENQLSEIIAGILTFGFFVVVINMVGLDRLELSTSPLSGVRSSHLSYRPLTRLASSPGRAQTGGAGRDRTGDLLNANQALSQLSYSPKKLNRGQLDAGQPSTRPTTTLTTSMNFKQESETYFQHSDRSDPEN